MRGIRYPVSSSTPQKKNMLVLRCFSFNTSIVVCCCVVLNFKRWCVDFFWKLMFLQVCLLFVLLLFFSFSGFRIWIPKKSFSSVHIIKAKVVTLNVGTYFEKKTIHCSRHQFSGNMLPSLKLTVRHGKSTILMVWNQGKMGIFHGRTVSFREGSFQWISWLFCLEWRIDEMERGDLLYMNGVKSHSLKNVRSYQTWDWMTTCFIGVESQKRENLLLESDLPPIKHHGVVLILG